MTIRTKTLLLAGGAGWMVSVPVAAQDAAGADVQEDQPATQAPETDAIVVTGSRIQNGDSSPTPVTIVSADLLQDISPATVADGLNKLPQFVGSNTQSTNNNASSNGVGNFLNLRGLGTTRTLILFDGHRLPDTAQAGGVDVNTVPQFLLQRVDVVTGGASAVYGSDAVAGVVNFVVDNKFSGLKLMGEAGVSTRGDNGTQRLGIGYGTDILGGRGHVLASYNYSNSEGIDSKTARRNGALVPSLAGNGGTVPFTPVLNARVPAGTLGGLLQTTPFAFGAQFNAQGELVPVDLGTAVGPGLFSGGETFFLDTGMFASLETHQGYGRLDYDLTDHVTAYVQGTYTRTTNDYPFIQYLFSPVLAFKDNPYLAPSAQATLAAIDPGSPVIAVGKFLSEQQGIASRTESYFVNGGLKGDLAGGDLNWDVSYSRARTTQRTASRFNVNNEKLAAASDPVRTASGSIVCRITQIDPARYPDCVPLNVFGPNSVTPEALDFVTDETEYSLVQTMDDFNATLTGSLIDLPAGPLKFALNGEHRRSTLDLVSNAQPLDVVDCTNLFLCTPGATQHQFNVVADATGRQNVTEGAVEVEVPILADRPFFHSLSLSGAARYTHYSTCGGVTTWKVGGDWEPVEGLRFRATRSRDIRAPNLNELFAPTNASPRSFADPHVAGGGSGQATIIETGGNPNLKPEKADTFTAGVVYRPNWLPRLSIAVDYYDIKIGDAIAFTAAETSNAICEASGGTDPFCQFIVRPLPFSDRTAANFPTKVISLPLNAAEFRQSGVDAEVNYSFPLFGGTIGLRGLLTYVDRQETQQFPNTPVVDFVNRAPFGVPRWRAALVAGYSDDDWTLTTFTRYRAAVSNDYDPRLTFDLPKISDSVFVDATVARKVKGLGGEFEFYLSAQNLFDAEAPILYPPPGAPGFFYPAVPGDDIIGRRVNAGFRAKF
jgi:outer membrane receptor protein involved in Fe transport